MGMNQTSGNKSSKNATNMTNSNILEMKQNKMKSLEEKIKEIGIYLNALVKDFEFIEDPLKVLANLTYKFLEEELRHNERLQAIIEKNDLIFFYVATIMSQNILLLDAIDRKRMDFAQKLIQFLDIFYQQKI